MKGRLQDMALADLVQHTCQDRKTAKIELKNGRLKAELFVKNGSVVHAAMGGQTGEEVFYELFDWDKGAFELKPGVEPPEISITRNWTSLLLEGARLADEAGAPREREAIAEVKSGVGQETGVFEIFPSQSSATTSVSSESPPNDLLTASPQGLIDQLSSQVEGHQLTCLTQMRGEGLYWSSSRKVEVEEMVEHINQFVKLVNMASQKLGSAKLEDNLLTTENAYVLVRFLDLESYYLLVAADKQRANLGNLRHLSRVYAERLHKVLEARSSPT
jgi:predicted regulator of Ras-like GTPase activity (Roadblock/LC7/MglB family)